MEGLTSKQRASIPVICRVLGTGGSMRSLLRGENKVCSWRTYYAKPRGWSHQERYKRVLEKAQAEYSKQLLEDGVAEAADELRRSALPAAMLAAELVQAGRQALKGEEVGSREQGVGESPVQVLAGLLGSGDEAVSLRAAAELRRLVDSGLRAGLGILDRADVKTAVKGAVSGEDVHRVWMERLMEAGEEGVGSREYGVDGTLADVGTEAGDVGDVELSATRGAGGGEQERGADGGGGGSGAGGQEPVGG